ncbi:MAG: exodeoxyribonuclease VII small subunit [Candidatus Saccharibacteria bacterium]|jgi:exodeoxyribonuclease VII small subunit|nr:MAG: exodeoxyribonuclease VII small subunit [Candidatus Saccharibacteria bacterium]
MSVKNKQTIAEKTAKLDELVAWFDSGDFELEKALDKYTEAEKLAQEIEKDLLALKNNIEIVKAKFTESE